MFQMSVQMRDTKNRILDTAERLFAEHGYDATSLRAITREAGANLAAVNYHFSSKEALLRALFARRLELLNQKRLAMLDAYEAEAGDQPVPVEKIVRALMEPVLRLGGSPAAGGSGFGILLGRMYSWPSAQVKRVFVAELREQIERFRSAFRRALPQLPAKELYWRIFFSIGAMAHTLAGSSLLEIISDSMCDPMDLDGMVERLIDYVVAGLQTPPPAGLKGKAKKQGRLLANRLVLNPLNGGGGKSPSAARR
jgi:AcrR family transcriptional regulator